MIKGPPPGFITSITQSVITNLKTTSVVNPLLIATAVITLPCLMALPWTHGWRAGVLVCFAAMPLIGLISAYAYFAKEAPDYLRSEDYQWKREAVQELGDKYRKLASLEKDVIATSPSEITDKPTLSLPPPEPQQPGAEGQK